MTEFSNSLGEEAWQRLKDVFEEIYKENNDFPFPYISKHWHKFCSFAHHFKEGCYFYRMAGTLENKPILKKYTEDYDLPIPFQNNEEYFSKWMKYYSENAENYNKKWWPIFMYIYITKVSKNYCRDSSSNEFLSLCYPECEHGVNGCYWVLILIMRFCEKFADEIDENDSVKNLELHDMNLEACIFLKNINEKKMKIYSKKYDEILPLLLNSQNKCLELDLYFSKTFSSHDAFL